jgi:tRNA(Arg) A34 adenosine deaminase TadA
MSDHQSITAIIRTKKGRVLSIGKNSYIKTHTLQAHYANLVGLPEKQYLHAEIAALVKCRDLSIAHSITVYRYGKDNKPLLAKPCPICQEAIKLSGIKKVHHT